MHGMQDVTTSILLLNPFPGMLAALPIYADILGIELQNTLN